MASHGTESSPAACHAADWPALAEYARRRRHEKIGIMADNAGALTGKTMSKYIADTDGAVGMAHIPPHTPQLNPI